MLPVSVEKVTQHADVHLEKHRTRAIGEIDIAAEQDADPNVRFDPDTPSLTIGGGDPDENGELRLRNGADSASPAVLSAKGGHGSLVLADRAADPIVSLDADPNDQIPGVHVRNGTHTTATIQLGQVGMYYASPEETPAVEADSSGTLTVTDDQGRATLELEGATSTLLLSGPPETGTANDDDPQTRYGGGELVLRSRSNDDIHLHATGETESSYGVDQSNRPRIHLNGPDATLELGRQTIDDDRPATNGEISLRTDAGHSVLEA